MVSEHSFKNQIGKAYYFDTIDNFVNEKTENIISQLTSGSCGEGFEINEEQYEAWKNQIEILQERLKNKYSGNIIFEYNIIRRSKRIDVILLIQDIVFSVEFKNKKKDFPSDNKEQAEDYAIDIKNFHCESENLYVCPILVATDAPKSKIKNIIDAYSNKEVFLQLANADSLSVSIKEVLEKYAENKTIDFDKWFNSLYCPTPTIINATIEAYNRHSVSEIAHSSTTQEVIEKCKKSIRSVVKNTREKQKKSICFVTGVPGAGKTLVGLDLAAENNGGTSSNDVSYISGNGPLVEVLRAALIKDLKTKKKDKHEISTLESGISGVLIRAAHAWRSEHFIGDNNFVEPQEHVLIFDEAQRCWDAAKMKKWSKTSWKKGDVFEISEPECILRAMAKKKDWCVLVCLVGLDQEINEGESGIEEWFRSINTTGEQWNVYCSDEILDRYSDSMKTNNIEPTLINELHLSEPVRTFKANMLNEFVSDLLKNEYKSARKIYEKLILKYPLYITRDVNYAKRIVRTMTKGSERCGLMACSSSQRLKPEGIYVQKNIDVVNWFLAPKDDLRSSHALEIAADEFKVQGLEVDYGLVCWDADLRRNRKNDNWEYFKFKGTKWQQRKKDTEIRYLINAYRVLLTRSRQGMIIFVPNGDPTKYDETRKKEYYDAIFEYLHSKCGVRLLEDSYEK